VARRKRKEEEAIWEPPEFDEVGYMRKEIENAKIALVVIAWAAVGALLAYLLFALNQPVIGFLLGIFAFGVLYFLLPMIGLPIHGFKRRDWISHASIYFFSWLAFSILLLNAPFGDHTSPVVGSFEVGSFNSGGNQTIPAAGTLWCIPATPGEQVTVPATAQSNKSVYVIFRATDNVAVRSVAATMNDANATFISLAGAANLCVGTDLPPMPAETYGLDIAISGTTTFRVSVTAVDTSGLSTTATITILAS
jgi:hypothetical protein